MSTIGLPTPLRSSGLRRMLDALGHVLGVRFVESVPENDHEINAWLVHEAGQESLHRIGNSRRPCYFAIRSEQLVPCGKLSSVEFNHHPEVPSVLRGRVIKSEEAAKLMALPRWLNNVTVLASKDRYPVWAMREREGFGHHYFSLPVPELNQDEALFQHFDGNKFLALLPLLNFLRGLTEDGYWEQPPLQACFMFDDPNLHWSTYGFVNFAEILRNAKGHNYHTSFAMIPLDTWFVHTPTADLFRRNFDRVSLLIHGNDHTSNELARNCPKTERQRVLMQALGRIDKFERRFGVEVSRVMAAPHGACSESTLMEMALLGFEAACISNGSLYRYNGQAAWARSIGMKPCEVVAGLPVFPRFRLSRSCESHVLVSALLNQPVIPVGHHHDLADGLNVLADLAGFINSLGKIHWSDMKRISRSHYARRLEGKSLRIKMFGRRIEVCVPEGTNQVWVERPWLKEGETVPLAWKGMNDGSEWRLCPQDQPISMLPGQRIEIVSGLPPPRIDMKDFKKFQLWPVIRRQITEARDRMGPALRRVLRYSIC